MGNGGLKLALGESRLMQAISGLCTGMDTWAKMQSCLTETVVRLERADLSKNVTLRPSEMYWYDNEDGLGGELALWEFWTSHRAAYDLIIETLGEFYGEQVQLEEMGMYSWEHLSPTGWTHFLDKNALEPQWDYPADQAVQVARVGSLLKAHLEHPLFVLGGELRLTLRELREQEVTRLKQDLQKARERLNSPRHGWKR